ncbi:MAG TPA: alkaline phosphatase family protein [Verrucomicrobiae bacterium]|nr:alkaline phosphatase family protein [Verrucomicrobiae bacterium]
MIEKYLRCLTSFFTASALLITAPVSLFAAGGQDSAEYAKTATPIKHVVVIFQENISFDHYFGTYPYATNPSGEPSFHALPDTPRVNNLLTSGLLDQNPNTTQPFRLDRSQALTCDQNHDYTPEQLAFDHGLMDKFPQETGTGGPGCPDYGHGTGLVMGYYDGNTVTAWWNYAQHFALSDNNYGTMFGPSTVGALNLAAGTTSNATLVNGNPSGVIANGGSSGAVIGDPDPGYDDCSAVTKTHVTVTGDNIGILLDDHNITWGWFQGGFAPTSVSAAGVATCGSTSTGLPGTVTDYVPHHNPFEYFQQTSNQHHLPPSSLSMIGQTDQANHQYDLSLFQTAINEGKLPAVTFLKAKAIQNGHPGNSDPLDEQTWLVTAVNAIMNSQYWQDTAIIITYDDSDGWYDHQMDTVVNQSNATDDELAAPGSCGTTPTGGNPGRCGYGPRLPLIVISSYAKQNYVDSRMVDQSSIIRFVEDNWDLGRVGGDSNDAKAGSLFGFFDFDHGPRAPRLILNPSTGEPMQPQFPF